MAGGDNVRARREQVQAAAVVGVGGARVDAIGGAHGQHRRLGGGRGVAGVVVVVVVAGGDGHGDAGVDQVAHRGFLLGGAAAQRAQREVGHGRRLLIGGNPVDAGEPANSSVLPSQQPLSLLARAHSQSLLVFSQR